MLCVVDGRGEVCLERVGDGERDKMCSVISEERKVGGERGGGGEKWRS